MPLYMLPAKARLITFIVHNVTNLTRMICKYYCLCILKTHELSAFFEKPVNTFYAVKYIVVMAFFALVAFISESKTAEFYH